MQRTSFEVYVSKDTFKFNAAHFVAFEGFRERLHGHNYRIGVRLLGTKKIGPDGYVLDFGDIKAVCKKITKKLNESFLCPLYADALDIEVGEVNVRIKCHVDGAEFLFPRNDCSLLPIVHATTEELAVYLYAEILKELKPDHLLGRNIHTMEVTVAESPGQEATFRWPITTEAANLDVRSFIEKGNFEPSPCLSTDDACPKCTCTEKLQKQLEVLARGILAGDIGTEAVIKDLQALSTTD